VAFFPLIQLITRLGLASFPFKGSYGGGLTKEVDSELEVGLLSTSIVELWL